MSTSQRVVNKATFVGAVDIEEGGIGVSDGYSHLELTNAVSQLNTSVTNLTSNQGTVKLKAADTSPGYLATKIKQGFGILLEEISGALQISASDVSSMDYGKIGTVAPVDPYDYGVIGGTNTAPAFDLGGISTDTVKLDQLEATLTNLVSAFASKTGELDYWVDQLKQETRKVSAIPEDRNPGTLDQKVKAGPGVNINANRLGLEISSRVEPFDFGKIGKPSSNINDIDYGTLASPNLSAPYIEFDTIHTDTVKLDSLETQLNGFLSNFSQTIQQVNATIDRLEGFKTDTASQLIQLEVKTAASAKSVAISSSDSNPGFLANKIQAGYGAFISVDAESIQVHARMEPYDYGRIGGTSNVGNIDYGMIGGNSTAPDIDLEVMPMNVPTPVSTLQEDVARLKQYESLLDMLKNRGHEYLADLIEPSFGLSINPVYSVMYGAKHRLQLSLQDTFDLGLIRDSNDVIVADYGRFDSTVWDYASNVDLDRMNRLSFDMGVL